MTADDLEAPPAGCPLGPACDWIFTWPAGYQDPPWQRTGNPAEDTKTFHDLVLTHRQQTIADIINDHLAGHGFQDVRLTFKPATGKAPHDRDLRQHQPAARLPRRHPGKHRRPPAR